MIATRLHQTATSIVHRLTNGVAFGGCLGELQEAVTSLDRAGFVSRPDWVALRNGARPPVTAEPGEWQHGGRKKGGSQFVTCMWIYTKEALTTGLRPNRRVFEEANVVHCAMHKLGLCWDFRGSRAGARNMELDCGFVVPCVVQWSLLWFSAPTRLNEILDQEFKIKKVPRGNRRDNYRNKFATIWRGTQMEVVHVDISGQELYRTHRKCGVNKEMEGSMIKGNLEP